MKKPTTHKRIVVLNLPKNPYALLGVARAIVQAMDANKKTFANPSPALAVITTAADDLEVAQSEVKAGAKNAVPARNAKAGVLVNLLDAEKAYVQQIANAADPAQAVDIIQSAAMNVKHVGVPRPRTFAAKAGPVSGSAKVVAPWAGPRSFYEWQFSADGGKTWVALPSTVQAHVVATSLQPGVVHAFRYRTVTRSGVSDWSEPTTLLVR
jgi:hypothetical protein